MQRTSTAPKRVGRVQLNVLAVIDNLGNQAYGGSIWESLEELEERRIPSSAIYNTIHSLVDKKLIAVDRTTETTAKGRPRVYYRLTEQGNTVLQQLSRPILAINQKAAFGV